MRRKDHKDSSLVTISVNRLELWGTLNETVSILKRLLKNEPVKDKVVLIDLSQKLEKLKDLI